MMCRSIAIFLIVFALALAALALWHSWIAAGAFGGGIAATIALGIANQMWDEC